MYRRRNEQPTAVEIKLMQPLENADAEQMLSQFIDNGEAANESVVNQLRRVQRDLRGLPPLLRNSATGVMETENNNGYEEDIDMEEAQPAAESEPKKLSKEERKRLKKERRKEEKRHKAEARQEEDDESA
ncbi:hypothetical protein TRVA0_001S03488 [Trichomonascus vanleenenianus]|uniref:uncharacterized protein n=1 Tax=Trichomonascus vanleenenianus TaxID=2268995 RepID=UPI003ECA8C24